ncbi:ASPIC/UnbV domain-containing protein [Ruegeria sp. ANG-S4]|uniref:CRTAC1 family protein n=1 Tax=Ruegeria sp. ANG-S4 TaxID=1577904 RepID=UPI00057D49AE|nr:CRTAC1 family protein [Ruegeria sp. ANG-S4]KIC47359.1 ASPIC/UnbV domain-containing protein [Ruegeria sp. ANG-S4]
MRRELIFSLLCATAASANAAPPVFERIEVAPHAYDGGWEHFVGGGVAVFDCDGDTLPELFVAGGSNPSTLFQNTSTESLSFREDTPAQLAQTGVTGAYPLDVDSDGRMDLVVLRVGQDLLLQGRPDCTFAPFESLGFQSEDHWTTGFSATWEDGQTLPTLAFGTYVDRSDPDGPFEACGPTVLYRPDGGRYTVPQHLEPGYCSLSILFSDWSRTGRADLRVSNDRHYYVRGGEEQLWSMGDTPRLYSSDDGWLPYSIWGMGIASRDLTGDGHPEVYLTSMGDQKFQVFDPEAEGPTWRDATYDKGTTAHRPHAGDDGRPSTGWHAQFGDVNNDGLDDIFVAKGNVEQMPDAAMSDPNNLMIQKENGEFVEASSEAGVASMSKSRGAALADLNNDGRLDLVVVNRGADFEVYQNRSQSDNWLLVDVHQDRPNRMAVGGFLEVKTKFGTQTREITVGGGHASGIAGMQHFGIGEADSVQVRIVWPGGETGEWKDVAPNQIIRFGR